MSTLLLLLAPALASADEYSRLAGELSRSAAKQGKRRVAVLPFQEIGTRGGSPGLVVAERLTGPLLAQSGVDVVERTMLQSVLREQKLQLSGATDPATIKELGRVLGVDAVVTGTVVELKDDRVELNARLIDAQTARILGAASGRVEKEWAEPLFGAPFAVPVPSLDSFETGQGGLRDAVADEDDDCGAARRRAARIEASLVDVKARYWATRLRSPGFDRASLKANPGSEIKDPAARAEFYEKLKRYYQESPSPMSDSDLRRLDDGQQAVQRVDDLCRPTEEL